MKILDSIAAPGSALGGGMKKGAGDDRFAFDESAGWAAVIDGATDVGPVRLYPQSESDAARYAEIVAEALVAEPVAANETPAVYMMRLALRIRDVASRESRIAIDTAPLSSLPTAAMTWMRARNGKLEGATLGDTLAIVRQPSGAISLIGDGDKPADEQARAKKVMAMTPEDRLKWLQDLRAVHNTSKGYWIFGVQPDAAGHVVHQSVDCPPGTRALLVTDGFYRLVSPYGRYGDANLIDIASERGLGVLMSELRGMEANAADDAKIGRFKTSDDATALLVEF